MVEDYLKQMIDVRKQMNVNFGDSKYICQEQFILENGIICQPSTFLPKQYQAGIIKECFRNAALLALNHKELIYCEGYALSKKTLPIAIYHAWCVTSDFEVVDNTWKYGAEYFGVPFKKDFLMSQLIKNKNYGLIDNYQDGWPLVRGIYEPEEFLYVKGN